MKYLEKTFTVGAPGTDAYRDGWDRIFGKRAEPKAPAFWTCPDCGGTAAWDLTHLHQCPRVP